MFYSDFYAAAWMEQEGGGEWMDLRSTRRRSNSPTPTRRRIKSSRDVGELVLNPIQLIRS